MIRHFFLDKTNTIIQNSRKNLGLNPILQIAYGDGLMRGLLHFDVDEIKQLIEDKTFPDVSKLTFKLKMTNCMSVDGVPYEKSLIRGETNRAVRAGSFDLVLYKLPMEFDAGRGFDFISDFWIHDNTSYSENGSNWFFAKNAVPWPVDYGKLDLTDENLDWDLITTNSCSKMERISSALSGLTQEQLDILGRYICNNNSRTINLEGGIWKNSYLISEFNKYINGEDSIIVGAQHFDFGNENLSIDITDYIMECLNTGVNHGLCLSFSPLYENNETDVQQYVGFFNDNTNTFFHPYVEATYCDFVFDNREGFTIGVDNNLCLYVSDNGIPVNLDNIPTCSINGTEFEVRQVTKGVYSARIGANSISLEPDSIYYDIWSNLALNGVELDDTELEFATNKQVRKLSIGSGSDIKKTLVPSIYGINMDEGLHRGEIREVSVDFREEFTQYVKELVSSCRYTLYTEDGNRVIEVLPYQPIEQHFLNNFFIIYTQDLIPGEYFVDIEVVYGRETKYYKKVLRFKVLSDVTERYE